MNQTSILQPLDEALALYQAGNFDGAAIICRQIISGQPDNAQALGMLGMLRMQQGNWQEGIDHVNASLAIDPNQPDMLSNLGYALQTLGRYEEALACYDKAIALYPGHVSAYFNRGNTLQSLERYAEAIESYEKAAYFRPSHADTWINLGNAHNKLEHYELASACYKKAAALKPEDAGIQNNLGLAAKGLKQPGTTLVHFKKAIELQPGYVDAHLNLAGLLEELGRHEEALASYEKVMSLAPTRDDVLAKKGHTLQNMKRYDEAKACYLEGIARQPANAEAHNYLGLLSQELGNRTEATEHFLATIRVEPESTGAYFNLAYLGYLAKDEPLFMQLQRLYARRDTLPEESQVHLCFAMGKTLEDIKRYDEAFAAYEEGNRLYHLSHAYDEAAAEKSQNEIVSFFTADLFEKCQTVSARLSLPRETRTPVFIVSMPRSGSTLIEQILSSHPLVFGAGELTLFDEITDGVQLPKKDAPGWEDACKHLRELGRRYLDAVWKLAPDAAFITDKMPGTFLHLGLLKLMLPDAKIIHAMRDPRDICWSCYAHHFKAEHRYVYDLPTLGRFYLRYEKLMRHWHEALPPDSLLDVRYEDVVAEPEREVRRMLDYVGLPWDDACLKFHENTRPVQTASVNQVRSPLYSSSVARWKPFEKHLGPLLEILGSDYESRGSSS
jgi:tetratricopeptide (TPR) repeat protein